MGQDIASLIVARAESALGTPYLWGGESTGGFDCSGLVQWAYGGYGVSLPRTTFNQIGVGAAVQIPDLRPGDLVFFDTDAKKTGPDHVGIYIGGGKFIHAPHTGDKVKISSLGDSYYQQRFIAGRRIPGVYAGDSAGVYTPAQEQAPKLDAATLAQTYGLAYSLMTSDPSLKKIFDQAVGEQWSPDVFTAHLKNSDWWKNNSESMRQAASLKAGDPATWKATLAAAKAQLSAEATKLGAILNDKQLESLANKAVTLAWNDDQIRNVLGGYIKFNDDHVLGGQAGAAYSQILSFATANGLRVSTDTIRNYAAYVTRGVSTMEQVLGTLRQQAAGALPAFSDQINAGSNVDDLIDPYRQALAKELGVSYTSIRADNPQIRAALNRVGKDGQVDPMSLDEFTTSLRQSSQWRSSKQAVDQTMSTGLQVLKAFGLAGG